MTTSRAKISITLMVTKPSHSNIATAAAVIATTTAACLTSSHGTVANGLLSLPRSASTAPKKTVRTATILGMKPEPGSDKLPVGKSPLSASTSKPTPTKKAPAT
jgi:hypothetical protein